MDDPVNTQILENWNLYKYQFFFSYFHMHIIFQNNIDDGQVILVNSMSGHRLSPLGGKTRFYSATKFAVNALLEGRLTNYY